MDELKNVKQEKLDECIKTLPPEQQVLVKTCFDSAQKKGGGRRYCTQWLNDTLLMRVQSLKFHRRMLRDNKLPLPSKPTLLRLLTKIRPAYDFSENLVTAMMKKAEGFSGDRQKRGINNKYIIIELNIY